MTLRANFSWTLVGAVAATGANWLVLVMIARWGTPEVLGLYSMAVALSRPLFTLGGLQLRGIQATDAEKLYQFRDYLTLRAVMMLLVALGLVTLMLINDYDQRLVSLLVPVAVAMLVNQIIDIYNGRLQQIERMDLIAKGQVSNAMLTILAVVTGMLAFQSLMIALYFSAVASLGVLMWWVIPASRRASADHDGSDPDLGSEDTWVWQNTWRLFTLALPMGIVMTIGALTMSLPRLAIGTSRGAHELGEFAAVASLLSLGTTLFGALGHAASPRLAKHFARRDSAEFINLFRNLAMIAAVLGLAAILGGVTVGPQVVSALYGGSYGSDADFIQLTAVTGAIMLIASVCGYVNTSMRQFRVQVPINFLSVGVLGIGCYFWIPNYGLVGAAGAMAVSYAAKAVASLFAIYRGYRAEMVQVDIDATHAAGGMK